ncbi:MAG: ATP-binding protein [Lachnospiraceae bacterium]|nr:ATP-binding protein [Lachnospiraceae bacterium]
MFENPFSPIFGGKPGVFFGRESILKLFDHAMIDTGSEDRAIFVTGTRGSGKTALLEQLSIKAGDKKRVVIDLGPENMIMQLVHVLAGFDEVTKTVSPQANVNILGIGGGVSTGSVSKTERIGRENLQELLLKACSNSKKGVLITVDEIQKVPIEDVSSLCNAFQMVSRKGHDIMLVVAGLPYAYSEIIRHEGCTYLRRATHIELGLFTWDEAEEAFKKAFSLVKGLTVNKDLITKLNQTSFGHPYLMQLLGYHLVLLINDKETGKKHQVEEKEIEEATANAIYAYEQRALKPLLDELPNNERMYLTRMSECLGEDRLATSSEIARKMSVKQSNLSRARAYLIDHGIIAAPEHGKVMFCIPYLADYVKKGEQIAGTVEIARQRRV